MWNTLKNAVERWPIAWLIAITLSVLPVVNWVGAALSVVIALRHGARIGFLPVLTTGSLLVLAFHGFFGPHGFHLDLPLATWIGIGVIFIPLWLSAVVLRVTRSLSLALQLLFVIDFACIWIGALIWGPGTAADWYNFLMNTMVAADLQDVVRASERNEYFQLLAQVMVFTWPAFLWIVQTLVFILARWMQSRLYNPGGFQKDFHQLRVARAITVIVVVGMLWATFASGNVLAEQWATLGTMLLSVAGLAWIHWYVAFKQVSVLWLFGLYVVIFVGGSWVLPLLSLVGVFDSSLDLRSRLIKGKTTP